MIVPGPEERRRIRPRTPRSGVERDAVPGLDLPLELPHRPFRRTHGRDERRRPVRAQLLLEPSGRSSDRVQPRGRRELRRVAEHVPELPGGGLRMLDALGRFPIAELCEARDELLDVTVPGCLGSDLAQCRDRDRGTELRPSGDGRSVRAERQPAAEPVGVVDRADVHPAIGSRLDSEDPGDRGPGPGQLVGEPVDRLQLVDERHVAQNRRVRSVDAQELFAPLGPTYDRVGATLSLGQDPRWRRFLVSRIPTGGHVLDVATGTGLVAAELLRHGHEVTGVDRSSEMLDVARRRFGDAVELLEASAEDLPFENAAFDHLTFTYLLRYVDDPRATMGELARVVRVGGIVASLEFGVPRGLARLPWELYVRAGLPLAGRALRRGWQEVGDFLGDSIRTFWKEHPLEHQLEWWRSAGLEDVRVRRLSLGGGLVMWGRKRG